MNADDLGMHPAADLPGVIEVDGARVRRTDLDFLVSARARELVAEEGIVVIDYRPLQAASARVSP